MAEVSGCINGIATIASDWMSWTLHEQLHDCMDTSVAWREANFEPGIVMINGHEASSVWSPGRVSLLWFLRLHTASRILKLCATNVSPSFFWRWPCPELRVYWDILTWLLSKHFSPGCLSLEAIHSTFLAFSCRGTEGGNVMAKSLKLIAGQCQVFWLPVRSTADGTRWYKMGIHGRSAVSKRWFARTFHSKSAASVSTMVLCLSSSVDGWASRSGLISPMPLKVVRNKRCFWSSADKLAPSLVRVTHSVNSYLNQVSKDSWHNQHDQHLVECRWTYWSAALVWLGSKFKTVWAACRGIAGSDLFACRMFGADIFPKADRAQTNSTWSWDALGAGMT